MMMNLIIFLGSATLAISFLVIGTPLYYQKVKPNVFFGYYLSKAGLTNERIWYAVNKMGGSHLIILGMFFSLNAAMSSVFLSNTPVQMVIVKIDILISFLGLIYSLIRTLLLTKQLSTPILKHKKA